MKTAAVIAEFNPFHKGHAWLLQQIRELSDADFLIVLMSGNFVQRGVPAAFDKFTRTEMALSCGADLVLELPCAAATGNAGRFAGGAVHILNRLGAVDELWFGSEAGELSPFFELARPLVTESELFQLRLKEAMKSGQTYPEARMTALLSELPDTLQEESRAFLSYPNNILGLSYVLELLRTQSRIRPKTIRRIGSGYHETALCDSFSSAAAIRDALTSSGLSSVRTQVPEAVFSILERAARSGMPITEDDFSSMLQYQLLQESAESLTGYLDVTEELANRILRHRNEFRSFSQFADCVKTRNLTRAAVSRALLHILLHLTEEDLNSVLDPVYVRMLGFRSCDPLFSELKSAGSLPLVSRPATLPEEQYKKELFASGLYEAVRAQKANQPFTHEYFRQIIRLR